MTNETEDAKDTGNAAAPEKAAASTGAKGKAKPKAGAPKGASAKNAAEATPAPKTETKPEAATEAKPEPAPEVKSEPAPEVKPEPKAEAKAETKTEPGIRVICMKRGGRRRGGRDWAEGVTLVPAAEMTKDLRDALKGDALFSVDG